MSDILKKRILVVEDEPMVAEVVERYLRRDAYEVVVAWDGGAALQAFERQAPDLIVLDVMLPGIDSLEVCRRVRARGSTPVIMLMARGEEIDRLIGLELGADDYVAKPFSPRELVARVKAVLRRTGATATAIACASATSASAAASGRLRTSAAPSTSRRGSSTSSSTWRATRARCSAASASWTPSGTTISPALRARLRFTSADCGRSLRPTLHGRAT